VDNQELVTDREVFLSLSSECEKVVDPKRRLPDFVFRRIFAKYYAIEYGYIYRDSFGMLLSRIAGILHDETVNYMTLDPNPADYYREKRFYGLVRFHASILAERYVAMLNPRVGISKLLASANVGIFWGSSLKWAIMGDRISWETAIVGVPENVEVPEISDVRCMDASFLSTYIKSQYHVKDPSDTIASDFERTLLANYPLLSWPNCSLDSSEKNPHSSQKRA
jgi:hypothetical protein